MTMSGCLKKAIRLHLDIDAATEAELVTALAPLLNHKYDNHLQLAQKMKPVLVLIVHESDRIALALAESLHPVAWISDVIIHAIRNPDPDSIGSGIDYAYERWMTASITECDVMDQMPSNVCNAVKMLLYIALGAPARRWWFALTAPKRKGILDVSDTSEIVKQLLGPRTSDEASEVYARIIVNIHKGYDVLYRVPKFKPDEGNAYLAAAKFPAGPAFIDDDIDQGEPNTIIHVADQTFNASLSALTRFKYSIFSMLTEDGLDINGLKLDRDPALFSAILEIMRDPKAARARTVGYYNKNRELVREMRFYGILENIVMRPGLGRIVVAQGHCCPATVEILGTGIRLPKPRTYPIPIMPMSIQNITATSDGTLYSICNNYLSFCYYYRPGATRWALMPTPQPRPHYKEKVHLITVNDTIYCLSTKGCWRFEADAFEWVTIASMPKPLSLTSIGTDGTRIYLAGGYDTSKKKRTPKSYVYVPKDNKWTEMPLLPLAMSAGSGAVTTEQGKTYFYFIGGYIGTVLDTVYRLDVTEGKSSAKWEQVASLNHARHKQASVVVDNKIWVIGGEIPGKHYPIAITNVEYLDGTWIENDVPQLRGADNNISAVVMPRPNRSLYPLAWAWNGQ